MTRRPPRPTRTVTLFPYTTRLRSLRFQRRCGGGVAVRRFARHHLHVRTETPWHAHAVQAAAFDRRAAAAPHARPHPAQRHRHHGRSEEHTSELQSLMRISYAVFCLKTKTTNAQTITIHMPNQ